MTLFYSIIMNHFKYILLVEDDDVDAFISSKVIKKGEGGVHRKITHCRNGKEALDYLLQEGNTVPDIIVLDLNMPVMSGIEFLENRLRHASISTIPVIILTSSFSQKDRQKACSLGVEKYLEKPLNEVKVREIYTLLGYHSKAS